MLKGEWELYKVNDTIFNLEDFYRFAVKQPTITFEVRKNKISGFSGCNRFVGIAQYTHNKITLLQAVEATEIGCERNIWEGDFFNRLSNIQQYKQLGDTLLLIGTDDRTLHFIPLK